jgi:nitronate monooxygenase
MAAPATISGNRQGAAAIRARLALPVVVAPMFLISSPEMVIAAAGNGIIGAFPAANARSIDIFEQWCQTIVTAVGDGGLWAVNLIVHASYSRFGEEIAVIARYRPPLVITALGSPVRVLETVHGYGGVVFADVASPSQARKAVQAGADGLVLVCAGAGGHTGRFNPFAFVSAVRAFWDGPLVLSGGIADAAGVLATEMLGADFAYMGTRFLACRESLGSAERKAMTVAAGIEDIVTSAAITGIPANWLMPSIVAAGFPVDRLDTKGKGKVDFDAATSSAKAWKDIWGAGHGVGAITRSEPVAEIVQQLARDYHDLRRRRGLLTGGAKVAS